MDGGGGRQVEKGAHEYVNRTWGEKEQRCVGGCGICRCGE
jgi:hypothetical protein